MKSFGSIGILGLLIWSTAASTEAADWWVRNNLQETFTVYVWPTGNAKAIRTCRVEPGQRCRIPLGEDTHEVELVSSGDDVYVLEPMSLKNRSGVTELKTILTPQGKENGRTVYQYMNQQGFDKGSPERVDELKWSAWKTKYNTPNGGNVETDLKFTGDTGTYNRGRGRLSEVTYVRNDGGWIVSGKWVFGDGAANGTFKFFVNEDGSRFSSNPNQRDSSWGGSRRRPRD